MAFRKVNVMISCSFSLTFDFSKTTQSDIKGVIKAKDCKKPQCINCLALKFDQETGFWKISKLQIFFCSFSIATTKVLGEVQCLIF